jgi:transposase-like protein
MLNFQKIKNWENKRTSLKMENITTATQKSSQNLAVQMDAPAETIMPANSPSGDHSGQPLCVSDIDKTVQQTIDNNQRNIDTITDIITQRIKENSQKFKNLIQNELNKLASIILWTLNIIYITGNKTKRFVFNGYYPRTYILPFGLTIKLSVRRILDTQLNKEVPYAYKILGRYERQHARFKLLGVLLYMFNVPMGSVSHVLAAITGHEVVNLSYRTVGRTFKNIVEKIKKLYIINNLSEYIGIVADASFFKTANGQICLISLIGLLSNGCHEVIALKQAKGENTAAWRELLSELIAKGLKGPKIFIADGAAAFWSAAKELFPDSLLQQCWVHVCRNVFKYMPKMNKKVCKEIIKYLKEIYGSANIDEAKAKYHIFINKFQKYSGIITTLKIAEDKLFSFFEMDEDIRKKFYTSNLVESLFGMLKNRTSLARGRMSASNLIFLTQVLAGGFGKGGAVKAKIDLFHQMAELIINEEGERLFSGPSGQTKIRPQETVQDHKTYNSCNSSFDSYNSEISEEIKFDDYNYEMSMSSDSETMENATQEHHEIISGEWEYFGTDLDYTPYQDDQEIESSTNRMGYDGRNNNAIINEANVSKNQLIQIAVNVFLFHNRLNAYNSKRHNQTSILLNTALFYRHYKIYKLTIWRKNTLPISPILPFW